LTPTNSVSDDELRYGPDGKMQRPEHSLTMFNVAARSLHQPHNHVSRNCMVFSPPNLRKRQQTMVQILYIAPPSITKEKLSGGPGRANKNAQPRLHPQSRSDPQIRPQHLPSMLPRKISRYRFRQGTPPFRPDQAAGLILRAL
jgi:hypothetical protein